MWLNDPNNYLGALKYTNYNNCVCMKKQDLTTAVSNFNTWFGDIINFTQEISSIKVYPFRNFIPVIIGSLKTATYTNTDVKCGVIDPRFTYLNLGQYYYTSKFLQDSRKSFAAFNGYTTVKIFLPFLGFVDLNPNEVMNKWIQFRLCVDFQNGEGMYIIGVSDYQVINQTPPFAESGEDAVVRVLSVYKTQIGIDIPLGESNASSIKRNVLLGAIKAAGTVFVNRAVSAAPDDVITENGEYTRDITARGKYKGARMRPVLHEEQSSTHTYHHTRPVNKIRSAGATITSSINSIDFARPYGNSDRTNDSSLSMYLNPNIKVVKYEPKFLDIDEDFYSLYGAPYNDVAVLRNLHGYTEISAIHFEGDGFAPMLNDERSMLEEIVSEGIILP